jgi:lipid-A-disaccharide synthase
VNPSTASGAASADPRGTGGAPTLALVAGEASGDLLGSLLLQGLRARWPDLRAAGIGGPALARSGFEAWWPSDRLAVRGYVEVLRHYHGIARIREQLARRLLAAPPAVFVGVDAPDFNLGLEERLKRAGIPTVHFVCPSIWAWRGGRVDRIARSAGQVLCLFPFEPGLLQRHGIDATYVGHPLAQVVPLKPDRPAARVALGLPAEATVVALLPGSRRSEIEAIAPPMLQAARRLLATRPGLRFVLPVAPGLRTMLEPLARQHGPAGLALLDGRSHEALAACDLTLVASGTATLEAALFKCPMVIVYRMHPLSWQLMKRMAYQPWVGLPNILAGEFLVPELIQGAFTPEALAREALARLDDVAGRQRLAHRFAEMHQLLRRDTALLAADALSRVAHF